MILWYVLILAIKFVELCYCIFMFYFFYFSTTQLVNEDFHDRLNWVFLRLTRRRTELVAARTFRLGTWDAECGWSAVSTVHIRPARWVGRWTRCDEHLWDRVWWTPAAQFSSWWWCSVATVLYRHGTPEYQQTADDGKLNPLIATLKPQSNRPSYSNTVIGTLATDGYRLLHLVQRALMTTK